MAASLPLVELSAGTSVKFNRGILAGMSGEIIDVNGRTATVSVCLLGERITLKVDTRLIELAAATS